MEQKARDFFSTNFGSAVLGGLIVGAFGWVAIAAGWIDSGDGGGAAIQPPLTKPVSQDQGEGLTVSEIYERDSGGVAFVEAQVTQQAVSPFNPFPQEQQSTASGSGFVIDSEGHILTNAHVVEGAEKITVKIGDGDALDAKLVGADPSSDIALLDVEADPSSLHPLELGDSEGATVGDPVVAIGNPFGLDRTVTSGIVSAIQREISAPNGFSISDVIQTDAPINPGNSGGPLLDAAGRVIGINSQIETGGSGQGNVGIGFAVPIDTAKDVVEQLVTTGEVKRAYLGIEGGDVTPELAKALNLPVEEGALVQTVQPDSPAGKAGIKGGDTSAVIDNQQVALGGDIIVEVNGEAVDSMEDVIGVVNGSKSGDELTLTLMRDGNRQDVKVTLGERPEQVQGAGAVPTPIP